MRVLKVTRPMGALSATLVATAAAVTLSTIGAAPAHAAPSTALSHTPVVAMATGSDQAVPDGVAAKKAAQERAGAGVHAAVLAFEGPYEFVNKYPFQNRACLDAFASGGGAPGNKIGLFHCTGGATQHWTLWRHNGSAAYPYWIVNAASGLCLTDNGLSQQYTLNYCWTSDGTITGKPNARQTFTTQAALPSGMYILFHNDPTGDGDILADAFQVDCCTDGMRVGSFWFTGSPLQKWDFVRV
jgi:hypothetical protein